MADIRGLTIHQPWATAITHFGKDVENRRWKPSSRFVDNFLAIHAGKRWDDEGAQRLLELAGVTVLQENCPAGAIIGVARLAGFVTRSESPWFAGPIGWQLADVVAIEPIPMVGSQGLWRLPANVLELVRKRWKTSLNG